MLINGVIIYPDFTHNSGSHSDTTNFNLSHFCVDLSKMIPSTVNISNTQQLLSVYHLDGYLEKRIVTKLAQTTTSI